MTTIHFQQLLNGSLLTVRAELHDDCLSEDGGGAAHVEEVALVGRIARFKVRPLSPDGVLVVHDAVEEICRVAAALRHRPWKGYVKPELAKGWEWRQSPGSDAAALEEAAMWWSAHQQHRHESVHPTGRSDAATYREEAPCPGR